jgi:homoserine kinase
MKQIRASAPATVANVCCGFDILGFAVEAPSDEVVLTLDDSSEVTIAHIEGDGGRLPRAADRNTASVAIRSYLRAIGESPGVAITLTKHLPLGSGMGSSAASAAAALVAINACFGNRLSREELIPHAMEAERVACGAAHADNVAPSLLGGMVLIRDYRPLDVVQVPLHTPFYCTLVHPHLELRTEDSRKVLKPTLALREAIAQNGNTAALMVGLMTGDMKLVGRSLCDVIAEPIRSVFIPGFATIRQQTLEAGGIGCGISGSGPTVFALSQSRTLADKIGALLQAHFQRHHLDSDVYVSSVNLKGAQVLNHS